MQNIGFLLLNTSMRSYTVDKMSPYLDREYSPYIFHIDSLTKDRAKRSKLIDSNVFDVGHLSTKELVNLFNLIDLRVLVFFTFQSDFDKYILYLCKILNIRTILHDHGIVYGNKIAQGGINLNFHSIFRKLNFLFKLKRINHPKIKKSNDFDHYLFFSKNNKQYYSNFFKLNDHNTSLSGLSVYETQEQYNELNQIKTRNHLIYIHQPFIKLRFSSISIDEEIDYLNNISDILNIFNYTLIVRLHPSVDNKYYESLLKNQNILIDNNTDLNRQIASSAGVIGHWSTALSSALVFHKPLFIIPYPKMKERFYDYYFIYKKVSHFCTTLEELRDCLCIKNITTNTGHEVIELIGTVHSQQENGMYFNKLLKSVILNKDHNAL